MRPCLPYERTGFLSICEKQDNVFVNLRKTFTYIFAPLVTKRLDLQMKMHKKLTFDNLNLS